MTNLVRMCRYTSQHAIDVSPHKDIVEEIMLGSGPYVLRTPIHSSACSDLMNALYLAMPHVGGLVAFKHGDYIHVWEIVDVT